MNRLVVQGPYSFTDREGEWAEEWVVSDPTGVNDETFYLSLSEAEAYRDAMDRSYDSTPQTPQHQP